MTLVIDHVVRAVRDLDGRRRAAARGARARVGPRWTPPSMGDREPDRAAGRDLPRAARGGGSRSGGPGLGRTLLDATADGDRWYAICVRGRRRTTAHRLGLEVEPGARTRPDGAEVRWRGAGFESPERDGGSRSSSRGTCPTSCTPGAGRAHPSGATGIAWLEVGGDRAACPSGSGAPASRSVSSTARRDSGPSDCERRRAPSSSCASRAPAPGRRSGRRGARCRPTAG